MPRLQRQGFSVQLPDELAERVRRNHNERITELQARPFVAANLIRDVVLESGVNTPVAHKMGRQVSVFCSPPRGGSSTGRIQEVRTLQGTYNPKEYVVLLATGWGADITVDVAVL